VIDRVEALRADIARGPAALADLLGAYLSGSGPLDGWDREIPRGRVAFVGLGSSRYAAIDAARALRMAGVAAWAEYASSDVGMPSKDLLLVAVSASGRTHEVVDLARRHRGKSLVVAVTNEPHSPLAEASDVMLPLLAGRETSGISTLTYRATVVVLGLLGGPLLGRDVGDAGDLREVVGQLDAAAGSVGDVVAPAIAAAADLFDGADAIDVIGPAPCLGAVSQAALMLREAPRLPAYAHETADWLHTAVYRALPGHRALLFTGSPADAEVVDTIRRRGGEVVAVGSDLAGAAVSIASPPVDPRHRTILESAVIDRLALDLWGRATALG
jgi:fructoselysine-6-P-deglycase FrlB-like protein